MVEKTHTSGFWPSVYEPLRNAGHRLADWVAPASEASTSESAYRIAVELPGVGEDDIHLSVQDGTATLKGEKRASREEKGETWFFSERQYGAFSRSFRLPPDADEAGVRADLKDGVLTLTIPKKSPEPPESARIKINKG
ncbi:MAG: Hsp20/alpha crystallin family protein [Pseudomonadota bacterium]